MQLDLIVQRIESAFGAAMPFSSEPPSEAEQEVLYRVFGDEGYQLYLQDQINRQIIRDYLTNAVMLGFLPQGALEGLEAMVDTAESRAALSLHMLMNSVEQAQELLEEGVPAQLTVLEVDPDSPPHIHLVQT